MSISQRRRSGGEKKSKKTHTIKNLHKPCCEKTYHGLHKWYTHLYEHLGWMVLAHSQGYNDKVSVYKHSLMRLKTDIEERCKFMHDPDKREDLLILHRDLLVLIAHVNKDF